MALQARKETKTHDAIRSRVLDAKTILYDALGATHGATQRITQEALKALEIAQEAYERAKVAEQASTTALGKVKDAPETLQVIGKAHGDKAVSEDVIAILRNTLWLEKLEPTSLVILAGGDKVAMTSRLPDIYSFTVGKDDKIDQYITLAIDMKGKKQPYKRANGYRVIDGGIMTHCIADAMHHARLQTLTAMPHMSPEAVRAHVHELAGGSSSKDGPGLGGLISRAARIATKQKKIFGAMLKCTITSNEAEKYFANVLEVNLKQLEHYQPDGKSVISTKAKNMLGLVAESYMSAPGAEDCHGTVWGALCAVMHYATHVKTCRDVSGSGEDAARFASNMNGDASALTIRALLLACALIT